MKEYIRVRGAKEHNLKNVTIDIPHRQLVVITGLSGSGKSSLAFDTIYAEGQRRYVESLSAYARQFLQLQNKPDVESITGLPPAIAIDQKTTSRNPGSTVGTITEIYDYLRLLFARIGVPYSPATGLPIESQSVTQMVDGVNALPEGTKLYLLAPLVRGAKGEYRKELMGLKKQGFQRVIIDGEMQELDTIPMLDKNKKHTIDVVIDRIALGPDLGNRLADSIETALKMSDGLLVIEIVSLPEGTTTTHTVGSRITFSERFSCPISGFQISEIEPRLFSFNSPYGACQTCDGLGTERFFDPLRVVANPNVSLKEGAIPLWTEEGLSKYHTQLLNALSNQYTIDWDQPFRYLSDQAKNIILFGTGETAVTFDYHDNLRRHSISRPFEGIIPQLEERLEEADTTWIKDELSAYQSERNCHQCHGYRLRPESLCIKVHDSHIGNVCEKTIADAYNWFVELPHALTPTQQKIGERILREIKERLGFLQNVGLEYLTLSRESGTLSGGESQRIRLASQIGSGLMGVLYVLDEPSIGLHQCDNDRLINTLKNLRDLGNTVLVVEHDEETMRAADYLIDVGPGAGVHGGKIIAHGTPDDVTNHPDSITGQYLRGTKCIPVPETRRKGHSEKTLSLQGAKSNNLKNISIDIPLGTFTAVTGVSGGGKSTLIIDTLYKAVVRQVEGSNVTPGAYTRLSGAEYIDKVIEIDQSPIGRTPRSNPATYTGAFGPIRDWYVELPESKARGYKAGRFSFNVKGGRCETCQGDGMLKIEMHFLPDVYVPCDACHGARYNRETLEIVYKGKSIADVLNMTVEDALGFFDKVPAIREKMAALMEVGLGYIQIGQSATTLSGGEAQRVKLAKELSRRSTGKTLYILDEPTTGLHTDDVSKLLKVLHKLVELGNTVLVIEHNLEVIKTADWVIDIGPGGGDKGGDLVAACTPEKLITVERSITGKYLRPYLEKQAPATKKKKIS